MKPINKGTSMKTISEHIGVSEDSCIDVLKQMELDIIDFLMFFEVNKRLPNEREIIIMKCYSR